MSRSFYARLAQRYGPRQDRLSRRQFLRVTAAASVSLLLSRMPRFAYAQSAAKPSGKRVVVIGAGFAGLACAHELKRAGYDATVIEARDRVGGRVLSFSDLVPGKTVEGGGELIGSNHPTWVGYAEHFNLGFLDVTEDESLDVPILLDGKRLSGDDAKQLYDEMDAAFTLLNGDATAVDADQPWRTPNAAALDKKTVAEWVAGLSCSDVCKRAITVLLAADNGNALEKQSYLGMLAQVKGGGLEKYWTESEVYRCKGGNQQLAHRLADAIGKDRVVLKLPVAEVSIRDKSAVVTCADHRTLECDDVILAVPPTVWKKIKFHPEIPASLHPQMGVNLKYLAAVKGPFWKDAKLAPDALTDGPVSETWDGTDGQTEGQGACLHAFSGGPAAVRCLEFPRNRADDMFSLELEKIYPGFGRHLEKGRFMDWPRDPWTMAGYSFPGPGQITTIGEKLFKGLGRLHFSGEHTCYKFVGYMEGGLNSGAALAKRIAQRDGVIKA
jgi:monoamine oxidase